MKSAKTTGGEDKPLSKLCNSPSATATVDLGTVGGDAMLLTGRFNVG